MMTPRNPATARSVLLNQLVALLAICQLTPVYAEPITFQEQIAPILVSRCLQCHQGSDLQGGLNLTDLSSLMQGGDSGAAIVAGSATKSLLWERVRSDEMPPDNPLTNHEKAAIEQWIEEGAVWEGNPIDLFSITTDQRAGRDWWSLQPLQKVEPPSFDSGWTRNSIDQFIYQNLLAKQIEPSTEADRHTLIRRLTYDLIGLPPTPREVEIFTQDTSDNAYEKLVDRLLNSPHYGERWGRHWLDVVHFGESNGFEYNQPRNNAWPYRNWVINSLNDDMPYDEFVRQQIAGDILAPDSGGTIAVACLVTGPHNTTKPSNDTMRKTMRQDEMEDMVGMVNQAFLGMTTNCARCHDHKFDPISSSDYYSMVSALAGVEFGERDIPLDPNTVQKAKQLKAQINELTLTLNTLEQEARDAVVRQQVEEANPNSGPQPIAAWNFQADLSDQIGELDVTLFGTAKRDSQGLVLDGMTAFARTERLTQPLSEKTLEAWVRVEDLNQQGGGVISVQSSDGVVFDAIVFAEREPKRWMAGSNGFSRYESFAASNETDQKNLIHIAITYAADGKISGYRNGFPYGNSYTKNLVTFAAGTSEVILGLRHGVKAGGNRMFRGTIAQARLYDRALSAEEVAASAQSNGIHVVTEAELVAQLTPRKRDKRVQLIQQIKQTHEMLKGIENNSVWTALSIPAATVNVLARGDVLREGDVVSPRGLSAIQIIESDFGLKPDAADQDRRLQLARWITDPNNPLFSRVIVNRIWHYHFGIGMVSTPNDFGFNGGKPTHPLLLDWLASELQENQWSLKHLHRLIVTSATYRQASKMNSKAAAIDSENRYMWRKTPTRLEGEALRDSLLAIAGKLDPRIGGKGYRDMKEYKFKGSHFYDPIPQNQPEQFRRTIYRFSPRGAKRTMLDTFDCPDPSTLTPQRAETTTPLQSLALMNNEFVLEMAQAAAKDLETHQTSPKDQVRELIRRAYSREAEQQEIERAVPFIQKHGLSAYCRVVFNSNELLYVR
jgi:hypothetical protein